MKNHILLFSIFCITCVLSQSCNTDRSKINVELLDSAKTQFIQFDKLPNIKKNTNEALLVNSIRLLQDILNNDPNNPEANYYLGYALDRKYNNNLDILNFDLISFEKTKNISIPFQKSILDTNYLPDYKLSQYSCITNIWGRLALNYIIKGLPDSAKFAFTEGKIRGGYTSANLEYASNLLNSLDDNAILIVNTDLEAYLLWYQQFIAKIRPDVSVINYSFLTYQWYAKWLSYPYNISNTLQTNLDDKTLQAAYSQSIITVKDSVLTINPKSTHLYSKHNKGISIVLKGIGRNEHGILLPISERITLAIILANVWQRPIYISSNASKFLPYSIGFTEFSKLEGLTARFYTEKIPINQSVNGDRCFELLTEVFKFEYFKDQSSYKDRDLAFIATNYRFMFIQALYYFSKNNTNTHYSEVLLTQFEKYFPEYYYPRTQEEMNLFDKIKSQSKVESNK